jgi:ParB family transcriptional regulator, chromosome partitioning protein
VIISLLCNNYVIRTQTLISFPLREIETQVAKLASSSDMMGIIEDVDVSNIRQTSYCLRSNLEDIKELAYSISQRGLLQAIVVRTKGDHFEVVAGNRRLNACKSLGWRKIPCHIVELDDREAFEVSLIENIQRQTMNPVDEANAFKKYVTDFGFGGVSQLAEKLGKSPSYVTKRIRLLGLPGDVLDSLINSTISPSTAEELLYAKDSSQQSALANLIYKRRLSLKKVREVVKDNECQELFEGSIYEIRDNDEVEKIIRIFDKSITALRIAMSRLSAIIDGIEENWIISQLLMEHKSMLHAQIDLLMKEKRKAVCKQWVCEPIGD